MDLNSPHNPAHEEASVSLKIILLIFAVVVIIALGYLVVVQNGASDVTDNGSSVILKKKTATANWKTYTNTPEGFSIKYPPEFCAEDDVANYTLNLITVDTDSVCRGEQSSLSLSWYLVGTKSLSEFSDQISKDLSDPLYQIDKSRITRTETTIDGQKAITIFIVAGIDSIDESSTVVVKNGRGIVINSSSSSITNTDRDNIISTFKFTN